MKAIFMGTPDFSVPVLAAMVDHGIEVAAVVTQPDRPKGRSSELVPSPVKEEALKYEIPVLQPEKVRSPESVEALKACAPDVIVVVAFGQILPKSVLEIPRYGCINVHASLLPAYRGAAPIQYAVIDGLEETGVTTMFMDEGLDTGDILLQKKIPLAADETGGSLFDKLSVLGAQALIETLDALEAGTLERHPQPEEGSYVGMIKKSMGEMDFTRSAAELERLVRGLSPWPSAYTFRDGKMLKVWKAEVLPGEGGTPGELVSGSRDSLTVRTGDGLLSLLEVQPEGKKRMAADAYLRGYPVREGERLGR